MTTQDPSVRLVTEESLTSGPANAILAGNYVAQPAVATAGVLARDGSGVLSWTPGAGALTDNGDGTWSAAGLTDNGDGTWTG